MRMEHVAQETNQELLTTIQSEFAYQVRYSDPINIHRKHTSGMEN